MTRDSIEGIAPREAVFGTGGGLPGQVFAAEILTRPVVLRRSEGELEVHVDRRGVTDAVYTTAGKEHLCRETLHGDRLETAARLDEDVHAFILEAGDGSWLEIPTAEIPLRWASGGVLPVVEWRGEVWSPFFFRDIPPVGWNIAAGSSETDADLRRPVVSGLREFVEETIVLARPPRPGVEIAAKTFPHIIEDGAQMSGALESVNRHLAIRARKDGLELPPFPLDRGEIRAARAIDTRFTPTRTRLRVRSEDGEEETADVLVSFNLLELGIEVISVVRYVLADDDYLLDGELTTPPGEDVELVRMPVAMVSHSYLKEVFGDGRAGLVYEHPPLVDYDAAYDVWKQVRADQPSVKPARPPRRGEIVVFGWDVDRRAELAGGGAKGDDGKVSSPIHHRHRKWGRMFARYFDLEGRSGAPRDAYPFFTAVSAKTVSYFFSQARENDRP